MDGDLQHASQDHILDVTAVDAGASYRFAHRDLAELRGAQFFERASEGTD